MQVLSIKPHSFSVKISVEAFMKEIKDVVTGNTSSIIKVNQYQNQALEFFNYKGFDGRL